MIIAKISADFMILSSSRKNSSLRNRSSHHNRSTNMVCRSVTEVIFSWRTLKKFFINEHCFRVVDYIGVFFIDYYSHNITAKGFVPTAHIQQHKLSILRLLYTNLKLLQFTSIIKRSLKFKCSHVNKSNNVVHS